MDAGVRPESMVMYHDELTSHAGPPSKPLGSRRGPWSVGCVDEGDQRTQPCSRITCSKVKEAGRSGDHSRGNRTFPDCTARYQHASTARQTRWRAPHGSPRSRHLRRHDM